MLRILIVCLTWSFTTLLAPPNFPALVREVMTDAEIAQFAEYLRILKPNPLRDAPSPEAPLEERRQKIWDNEQQLVDDSIQLARLAQTILPRNIVKLAEKYPDETVWFLIAASEHQPPMSQQLNALIYGIANQDVRETAAGCLIDTLEEDPHHRETIFRHLSDHDPDVRRALALNLLLRVTGPLTEDEAAKLRAYRDLAVAEGDAEMIRSADYLLTGRCDRVHGELDENSPL